MKLTKKLRRLARLNSRIFFILLITIAAILAWLSTQYNYQADWTSSGRHTLSEASQTLLSRLDGPVNITAYARDNKLLRKRITRLIERYQRIKPDITLNYINPDVVPDKIRELGISVNGELVIHYGDRSEHVQSHSEDDLTNALHRLVRGEQRWLAFIEGHGERKPFGHANHDLSDWVQQLTKRGLKVHPLKLATIESISDNTAVLVIAGPEVDLLPGEVAMIVDYVDGGGNVLWLADPGSTHGLTPLAEQLGLAFQPGTIVHPTTELYGIEHPTIILVTTYGLHPAIEDFPYLSVFPKTVGIELNAPDGWHGEALLITAEHAWSEIGELNGEITYNEGSDIEGPLVIGVALSRPVPHSDGEKEQRLVIIGDGDFLSNTYLGNIGNLDLGLKLMNWLAAADDLIDIPARTVPDLTLELSYTTSAVIGFTFLLVLPLVLLSSGLIIWWRRNSR
ncbi:MAG: GldG family protein [Gammaproteobacteria bacterium]